MAFWNIWKKKNTNEGAVVDPRQLLSSATQQPSIDLNSEPSEELKRNLYVEGDSRLSVRNVVKIFKRRRVVDGVSFNVKQGEVVGILGPNGAGKTTSFYMSVGLIRPDMGRVFFDKTEITDIPMYKRARKGISYLPQEASIFRRMTVEDNIRAVLEIAGKKKKEIEDRTQNLLEMFHITHIRKQMGYSLSGGERRRVEIARALANAPKILLLDEPFAGVDPIAVKDIQIVVNQVRQLNIGILITDHNVRETLRIVSRAYIMAAGKVLVDGTSEEIINNPDAKRLYLGDDFTL